MKRTNGFTYFGIALSLLLLLSLILPVSIEPALAHPGILIWSVMDTPNPQNNIIASPSEINVIAVGVDGRTLYAVDIPGDQPPPPTPPTPYYPNGKVYKSTDGGITWPNLLNGYLTTAGAVFPVWNIAVAPDDVDFVVAVTNGPGAIDGPARVFVSENGGATWDNTNLALTGEFISCVDISMDYGGNRDIAIGTRTIGGAGSVYCLKRPGFGGWVNQNWTPPGSPAVVALKFSPTYSSDSSLVVISVTAGSPAIAGTFVNLGARDTNANTTTWNTAGSYPVRILDTNRPGTSPRSNEIITADLELPSDFSGQTIGLRRYFVSTDVNTLTFPNVQSGIHRVDDTVAYWIRPPATAPTNGRISSISYFGTYGEGILLAGEVEADPATGKVYVWRASDLMASVPEWRKPGDYKAPTGGGTSGFANAQVAWSPDGTRAYCGTSSANPTIGGTAWSAGQWPRAWTFSVQFDESAFSVSPYSPAYEQLLVKFGKPMDDNIGDIWNQLSLIDTQLGFLSDVAVLEVPGEKQDDYDVLYLASIDPGGFDSLWRTTSDPLGRFWERVLCTTSSATTIDEGKILRIKQTSYDEGVRSKVIVFADLGTKTVGYSDDEGQRWNINSTLATVTDLALTSNELMYILSNAIVYRYEWTGANWIKTHDVNSELDTGHTIAVPLKNPQGEYDGNEDWVIVGETGPPGGSSKVAYADFSSTPVVFKPPIEMRFEAPVLGDVHVIFDDRFEQNNIIYVGVCEPISGTTGRIYRWKIGANSTKWDELEPPNNAFYGMAQRNDVLYGVWNTPGPASGQYPGVDRTLYPRATVPPPPEWDDLTAGLPETGDANFPVRFTREPSSLKISSNEYNHLWAIDNRPYNWANKEGCLWAYADTVSKVGPWSTTPATGEFIPVDPVSGRAKEVNFGWRQLSYSSRYELQLAKDRDFSIIVLLSENITPVDQLSPACIFPSGGLVPTPASGIANWANLESNHTYYWRVRATGATTGDIVRSPWSATMYFTVMAGLPVKTTQQPLVLLNPPYGARNVSRSLGFSWSPMPGTTQYEFVLAKDAALTQVVVKTSVPTTSYIHNDALDWSTSYFWQVKAIEPVVSEPSAIGSFTVAAEPEPEVEAPKEPVAIPFWIWAVIAIYAALMAAIIALVVIKPSYVTRRIAAEEKTSPMLERSQNSFARAWNALTMRFRRWRYLRKSKHVETDSSGEE